MVKVLGIGTGSKSILSGSGYSVPLHVPLGAARVQGGFRGGNVRGITGQERGSGLVVAYRRGYRGQD